MADEKKAEGQPDKTEALTPEQMEALLAKRVAEIEERVKGEYKSEIAGLNRKIGELEKAKKETDESKRTVEERVKAIEEAARLKDAELARERLIRQLHAEADKRGLKLDDELPVDKLTITTVEEGVALLDRRVELLKKRDEDVANRLLKDASHKPGAGGEPAPKNAFAGMSVQEIERKIREDIAKA